MGKVTYLGRFTPSTGGVTAKNIAIYNELNKSQTIRKIDMSLIKSGNVFALFSALFALLNPRNTLIIGTAAKMRRKITRFLYLVNRPVLNRSILIVMGGTFGKVLAKDTKFRIWVSEYKRVYVETNGMIEQLTELGVTNVALFPNCRNKPHKNYLPQQCGEHLKCVYFSMIRKQKGVGLILDAASQLPAISIDFYGSIDSDYRNEFLRRIEGINNCKYKGVHTAKDDTVYELLNEYDVFLFPTEFDTEGVPGALVESKIAACTAIVSDRSFNAELVGHGKTGVVMQENTVNGLVEAILKLELDHDFLMNLKSSAKQSGEAYYFENYIRQMEKEIQTQKD